MADVDITVSMIDKTKAAGASVNQTLSELEKNSKGVKSGLSESAATMSEVALGMAKIVGVAAGVGYAAKQIYDFGRAGAELEFTRTRFDRLAESIGTTSDALLEDLHTATRGMYSDSELLASAGNLMALGLAKTHDEAVRLATVSGGLNMNMNQLVLTLTNMTTMRFDALGVSTDGFKEKMKALEEQGYSTDAAFKEAFLQQAEMQLEKVGNAADTNLGSFMRLEAQMKNNIDRAKEMSAQGLGPMIGYLADSTEKINTNAETLKKLNTELYKEYSAHKVLTPEMQSLIASYERGAAMAELYGASTDTAAQASMNAAAAMEEERIKAEALSDKLSGMVNLVNDMQAAENSYTEKSGELADKRAEAEAAVVDLRRQGFDEYSTQIQDALAKVDEIKQAEADLAAEREKQTLQFLSNILAENLARDGWTEAEFNAFAKQQEAWGLWSADVVAKAQAAWEEVDKITSSIENIPTSKTVTISALYETYGDNAMIIGSNNRRAKGGPVNAGESYLVGEQGMEIFTPSTSGTITPNHRISGGGSGSSSTIINIMLDSATPDPERVAYNLEPAVRRVVRKLQQERVL